MAIALLPSDFEDVGQVASHVNKSKLNQAVNEAKLFDLEPLFGEFWYDIEQNWTSVEPAWVDLRDGSEYQVNDKTKRHLGVKQLLVYFAYARYVVLNGFNDTATGIVSKTNDFSVPKPLKELNQFSDKYRNMGYTVNLGIQRFLCNSDEATYPNFDRSKCGTQKEYPSGETKGFGIRGSNISKYD